MEDLKTWMAGKKKVPKFVAVYDKLYKMISEGEFDGEDKLPSEPALAELMGVSRMTLRQAIDLLQDDGIIKKVQGKGNFLLKNSKRLKRGLELLQHPVYSAIEEEITETEIEFNIELPSDYTKRILGENHEAVLFVDRWYKVDGVNIAYTLTMLSTDIIQENHINLEKKEELIKFLDDTVYTKPNTSHLRIGFSETLKFVSPKYSKAREKKSFLLEEVITLSRTGEKIHNKHYIPVYGGDIIIDRK